MPFGYFSIHLVLIKREVRRRGSKLWVEDGLFIFTTVFTLYSFSLRFQWLWAQTPLGSFLVHSVTHVCLPV